MAYEINQYVYRFAVAMKQLLGNELSKVILYGSYARGDADESSDVDVMVLVKIPDEELSEYEDAACNIAFDMELETGIHISPLLKNEENFEHWTDALPFYRNIKNEGIQING